MSGSTDTAQGNKPVQYGTQSWVFSDAGNAGTNAFLDSCLRQRLDRLSHAPIVDRTTFSSSPTIAFASRTLASRAGAKNTARLGCRYCG